MPTFRALKKIVIKSRSRRFMEFLEQFLTPTPSREKAATLPNLFFNPGVERKGPVGLINEFMNPRVRRYGFWKLISQVARPEPPRSGFMKVVTAFLDAPVYRLEQGGGIIRPRQREANFLQKLISGLNEFLNAYTHFGDLFKRFDTVLEVPTDAFRNALDRLVFGSRLRIEKLTEGLMAGRITPREYQVAMMAEVRRINIATALLGIRGIGNITPSILLDVDAQVTKEIMRLQNFLRNSFGPNLTQPLDLARISEAQFRAYANRFASAGRASSTVAQAALMQDLYGAAIQAGGVMHHRRIVVGDDNSCDSCLEYAGIGWVRVDSGVTLPPPGTECECEQNCRCLLEYCLSFSAGDCPEDYD